jgi:hypothetical protein
MSSPVVAGSVALMLEANPTLTPNLVKAILQYTAQEYAGYNALTQGAGFLNTKGAVDLARFFRTAKAGDRYLTAKPWSKKLLWGNQRLSKGVIKPNAPAWKPGVVWGAAMDADGDNVVWGTYCADECANVAWGTSDSLANVEWGTATASNVVWGTSGEVGAIVWGSAMSDEQDNLTWGNSGEDAPMFDDPDSLPATFDASVWEDLFAPDTFDPLPPVVEAAPAVVETTEPVVEELPPAAEQPPPVAEEPLPLAEEPLPVVEEPMPAVEPTVVESIVLTPIVGVIGGI